MAITKLIADSLGTGVGGKVLQVVSTAKTDSFSTTSSSFTDVTGMSVSITPSSTSSKILIHCRFSTINDLGSRVNAFNLVRDSTAIAQPDSSSWQSSVLTISSSTFDNADYSPVALHYLDSPSTTSAITYKLQCKTNGDSSLRIGNRSDGVMSNSSDITVMEIAG